jgi:hypothetical protein
MFSLRLMSVLAAGFLTVLVGLATEAKACPPGRRYVVVGSSFYQVYSPAYSSTSGAAYYYDESNAAPLDSRVVPAAFETISTNRPNPPRPSASLSEQTSNDNFANSGQ